MIIATSITYGAELSEAPIRLPVVGEIEAGWVYKCATIAVEYNMLFYRNVLIDKKVFSIFILIIILVIGICQ